MTYYVGLDVSLAKTSICVVGNDGIRTWRGECASDIEALAAVLANHAPGAVKIGLETGPLSVWLTHGLRDLGFSDVCLDARHAKAALSAQLNKTDANDAEGLAQIVRTGWYREVTVKRFETHLVRGLISARTQLVNIRTELGNQIRGLLKIFGLIVGTASGNRFGKTTRSVVSLRKHWSQGSRSRGWRGVMTSTPTLF